MKRSTYHFGQKNNWRRWQWNRIVERLRIPANESLVLYLAGVDDEDRPIAKSHGFTQNNLIAIESNEETLRRLRKTASLAIKGDLFETLFAWPKDRSVEVIVADLCGGLHLSTFLDVEACLFKPSFTDSIFAINLLRGRDPSSNMLRQFNPLCNDDKQTKHRAMLLVGHILNSLRFVVFPAAIEMAELIENGRSDQIDISMLDKINDDFESMRRMMNPTFNSYRSECGQQFDSAVFKNPVGQLARAGLLNNLARRKSFKTIGVRYLMRSDGAAGRGNIGAILAHRTMRMK